MNKEPELSIRNNFLNIYNSRDFDRLIKEITSIKNDYPYSIFILSLLGNINNELENYNEAINNFDEILKINPNFDEAHYNLGIIYKKIDSVDQSISCYKNCIKINPNKFEAYNNLGNIYKDKQENKLAIEMYIKCLEINPNYLIALQNFGVCLQNYRFSKQSNSIEKHIINLLDHNKILRPVDIINCLLNYIILDKEYKLIIESINKNEINTDLNILINKFLNQKILIKLLEITPITDTKIEKCLRYLRAEILLNIKSFKDKNNVLKLISLIASQCFINEYIYPLTLKEEQAIIELEKQIEFEIKNKNLNKVMLEVSCLGAYRPLISYSWSHNIKNIEEIRSLYRQQVENPIKEIEIRNSLKIREIKNTISLKVKDQYENSPYPRWEKIALNYRQKKPLNFFKNLDLNFNEESVKNWDNVDVLVAGCGTGQHAITTATKYENSFITAIDLSATSLSYAKRKAEELNIKNIEFLQMDILDLVNFDKKFNIIEAVGVLHHMAEPFKGWKTLNNRLIPGGLMMIGLYSKIARDHIGTIRDIINKLDIKINKKNIINFREKIISSNANHYKLIKQSPDFYSLSNLVDLLFHVQEHRFTISDIDNYISKINLKFCGFENKEVINLFIKKNKNKHDLYNLDLWNEFEINNNRIFAGMYQFWCQKL